MLAIGDLKDKQQKFKIEEERLQQVIKKYQDATTECVEKLFAIRGAIALLQEQISQLEGESNGCDLSQAS